MGRLFFWRVKKRWGCHTAANQAQPSPYPNTTGPSWLMLDT